MGGRRRYIIKPPDEVVAAAIEAGIDPDELCCGVEAGLRAGYGGKSPDRGLAKARRAGRVKAFAGPVGPSKRFWFVASELDRYRAGGFVSTPGRDSGGQPSGGEPADVFGSSAPGGPVGRVEHELELEVTRLRAELDAVTRERDFYRSEMERARSAAAAIAGAYAGSAPEPPPLR